MVTNSMVTKREIVGDQLNGNDIGGSEMVPPIIPMVTLSLVTKYTGFWILMPS